MVADEDDHYTVKYFIHYGGRFVDNPFRYVGGQVNTIVVYDYRYGYHDLLKWLHEKNYKNFNHVYYKVSRKALFHADDLRLVIDDGDALGLFKVLCEKGSIKFYLEHNGDLKTFIETGGVGASLNSSIV